MRLVTGLFVLACVLPSRSAHAQACPAAQSCSSSSTAYSYTNSGTGNTMYCVASGGRALWAVNNSSSSIPTLEVQNSGSGRAAHIYNASSTYGTLEMENISGPVLKASAAGSAAAIDVSATNGSVFKAVSSSSSASAIDATSSGYNAVQGIASAAGVSGVYGQNDACNAYGVAGRNSNNSASCAGSGVFGEGPGVGAWGGYFDTAHVVGSFTAGSKLFLIDHPLAPTSKYLTHVTVESPDMKTMYDGIAVLDSSGTATVTLPSYFEALNSSYRYQLTPIGAYAPVYVSKEVANNQFTISGGISGMRVSWLVTGVRKDAFANANRIPVEYSKPASEIGTYLHPEAYGQPASSGLGKRLMRKPTPTPVP